jgi:hypothetical protein
VKPLELEMDDTTPHSVLCEGWWEEHGYGRQPMENLRMTFNEGDIRGSGTDIIGPFTFSGFISDDGQVAMVKHYIGVHTVDYFGTYDGEGVMRGEWMIGFCHGPWMIRIRRTENASKEEIREYVPRRKVCDAENPV